MTPGRPTDGDPIRDFIEANWVRYTRETITQQLIAAGHDKAQIDEAWEVLVAADSVPRRAPSSRPPTRYGITVYVFTCFVVGVLGVLGPMLSTSYFGLDAIVWLVGYIVLGGIIAFFTTRAAVAGAWWVLAIPLVPVLYVAVWFGTCLAVYNFL